ncbi:MAG: Dihydrolipoamide acetyltransferase component of pyruvate dehydrogenase complex [Bryobacterales bacterium]|nr:Dihydrolipoamide acetyltransferase component of pyruvate dehydrogenase complex [Bryobacterales bacterium]
MAVSVVMPALELAQETGKVLVWIKKEGDKVVKGEPLLEIETDKVSFELEAQADGILAGVRSREGDVVPVGQIIAWLVAPGELPPVESDGASRGMAEQARPMTTASAPAAAAAAASALPAVARGPRISPKARRIAEEKGVDIAKIQGTGPDGQITGEDVLKAAETPVAAPAAAESLSAIARLMAERTTQSWTTVPHFFLARDVDAAALNAAREQLGRDKFTHTDFLIALVARVLLDHPKMNASWTGSAIRLNPAVNISLAIAVPEGVVGAVIPNAATIAIGEIATQRKDLAERAKAGRLRPTDITGGTFTISNLGMYGIDAFSAIITSPQAAVLAVGRITDRVVAVNGQPAVRPVMTITLSSDHRVVDGAQAASFLNDLAGALENTGSYQKL